MTKEAVNKGCNAGIVMSMKQKSKRPVALTYSCWDSGGRGTLASMRRGVNPIKSLPRPDFQKPYLVAPVTCTVAPTLSWLSDCALYGQRALKIAAFPAMMMHEACGI